MRVSIAIMAHPKRRGWAEELSRELSAPIAWDTDNTEWHTGAEAWSLRDPRADWHLVVQDDAVLTPGAVGRMAAELSTRDHAGPVSLYVGTGRPRSEKVRAYVAQATGWFEMPWLNWGVAVALPVRDIDHMLSDVADHRSAYDVRISRWYESRSLSTLYAWPCLADHRDDGSLLGHDVGPYPRRARSLEGRPNGLDSIGHCGRPRRPGN